MYIKRKIKHLLSSTINNALKEAANSQLSNRTSVYIGNNRVLSKTVYGQKIICSASDISLTPHIIHDGYWENWITKVFLEIVKPGMTVLDIGANIGYYSLLAASRVGATGKVISFEANPELADILASNFSINGYLNFSTVNNIAVYSEEKQIPFTLCRKHLGSSSLWMNEKVANAYYDHAETIIVQAKPLDSVIPKETQVDFIKMDAEGAELHILKGGHRIINENKHLMILSEFSHPHITASNSSFDEFIEKIHQFGFSIYEITTDSQLIKCSSDRAKNIDACDVLLKRD